MSRETCLFSSKANVGFLNHLLKSISGQSQQTWTTLFKARTEKTLNVHCLRRPCIEDKIMTSAPQTSKELVWGSRLTSDQGMPRRSLVLITKPMPKTGEVMPHCTT
ncbi:hypothetical protein J4Q44_G00270570 [Coregonus suidteri]|uniref:Uncharacterized protein n=1 Tax=Coregonus suidteri TaxID=861788 RepID=A0AAN8L108_9TELE